MSRECTGVIHWEQLYEPRSWCSGSWPGWPCNSLKPPKECTDERQEAGEKSHGPGRGKLEWNEERRWSSKVCWSNEREQIAFLSSDCRMMQVRRDVGRHLAWPGAEARRALRPGDIAQGFIQSGLENLQGQKVHHLSVQPVPLLGCPYGE